MDAKKLKSWISAFRLRTLPLSLSSIALGSFLAYQFGSFNGLVLLLAILTTLFLQILSNLANDYGDGVKGTDNAERIGPQRAIQSGVISPSEMLRAILVFSLLSLVSGLLLIFVGTQGLNIGWSLFFLLLGLGAIAAAIKYTVGKNPYGYAGYGDFFVYLFFGLVGVVGTFYLHSHQIHPTVFLPASSMGLLGAAVLNLNNMRDIENDGKAGKRTLVVKIGAKKAKVYHAFLILGAIFCALLYTAYHYQSIWQWCFVISLPLLLLNLQSVYKIQDPQNFDPLLKKLALSTTFFVLTFGIAMSI